MLRIPHCLDNRLTDGGKVVSPTHRPRSTPHKHYFSALILLQGERVFSSQKCPDWLCGPLNFSFNGYRELFPMGKSDRFVTSTNHHHPLSITKYYTPSSEPFRLYLHLAQMSRMVDLCILFPMHLHGLVHRVDLNFLQVTMSIN
jgi:hypothetical protein